MPQFTYAAEPKVTIAGQPAPPELLEDILHLSVEESLHLPSMFTLVIKNSSAPGRSADRMWQHESLFEIGKAIKIGFVSTATTASEFSRQEDDWILEGEITAIEAHFSAGAQAPIVIRGYDVSHRLHRGRFNRSFQNIKDSDIVKKVIGEMGIPEKTIDATKTVHDYVFQENQTNMEFLRERAALNGFELFVQMGKLHFRKPKKEGQVSLEWLKELTSFNVRVSSSEQVKEVEVRAWDYKEKRAIVQRSSRDQDLTTTDYRQGSATSSAFQGKPASPKLTVVDQPVSNADAAQTIADALFYELSGEFVHADAQAQGNPQIRPGKVIELKSMGKYSGNYYVTDTRHVLSERVYTTEFSVRGLRGGDLLSLLSPPAHLQPGQTLMVGIVTDNRDPDGLGRVKVKLPTLTEEHTSYWARMVTIGAGGSRGFDCLPEVDDEVLVGFEHGDIHRPYIMGTVWNGKDKPPTPVNNSVANGKVRLRTFQTRTGHTLQFVEEDQGSSAKGIRLTSVYGHQIYLNDRDRVIEIKTPQGHHLKLDDSSKAIDLKSSGSISVKALTTLNLEAGGIVTVKGSLIKLN